MTFSRDLQLCPECIQLYLISTFRITFYHYLDNFSAEESALFRDSMLMSSIWTSDILKQATLYGGKNASSLYEISEALFPQFAQPRSWTAVTGGWGGQAEPGKSQLLWNCVVKGSITRFFLNFKSSLLLECHPMIFQLKSISKRSCVIQR